MLFAVLTTIFLFVVIILFAKGKVEDAVGALLLGGFVWAFVCLLILPFEGVHEVETNRVPVDNDSIRIYDLAGEEEEEDIVVYTDADGIEQAIYGYDFNNGEPEAAEITVCNEPNKWLTLFAWDACNTELVGNTN